MSELRLSFSNRQQADHPLSPGVHRVLRQPNGVLGIGDALPGVLLAQLCLDRRGLWLQVPAGARGLHVNGRPVQRMALLRAGDAVYVDGVELLVQSPVRAPPATGAAPTDAAGDPPVVLRGVGGPHHGRSLTLARPCRVGSARDADIRIENPAFPLRHALLERCGQEVLLRGLGPGPSLVNGMAVTDALLGAGDQVVFDGQHRFLVESPAMAAAPLLVDAAEAIPARGQEVAPARRGRTPMRLPWLLLAALLLGLLLAALLWFGAR